MHHNILIHSRNIVSSISSLDPTTSRSPLLVVRPSSTFPLATLSLSTHFSFSSYHTARHLQTLTTPSLSYQPSQLLTAKNSRLPPPDSVFHPSIHPSTPPPTSQHLNPPLPIPSPFPTPPLPPTHTHSHPTPFPPSPDCVALLRLVFNFIRRRCFPRSAFRRTLPAVSLLPTISLR